MRLIPFVIAAAGVLLSLGCEPEIGAPCDPVLEKVLDRVQVQAGTNDLVRDVALDSCSAALCASTDGSRPYCTKQCEADVECAEAGEGFTCQAIVSFGELACVDFTPVDACDADGNGDGFPCDCIDADGQPSALVKKYCAASAATIDARDAEFGREKFVAP
jgi:hypothetical protein